MMKRIGKGLVALMVVLLAATGLKADIIITGSETPRSYGPVDDIRLLVQAGVETNVVFAYIDSSPALFGMSLDDILALRANGVPVDVMVAMLRHDAEIRQWYRSLTQDERENLSAPQPGDIENVSEPNDNVPNNNAPADNAIPPQSSLPDDQQLQANVPDNAGAPVVGGWIVSQGGVVRGRSHGHGGFGHSGHGVGSGLASDSVPGAVPPIVPVVPLNQPVVPLNQPTVPLKQPTVPFLQPVVPLIQSPTAGAHSRRH